MIEKNVKVWLGGASGITAPVHVSQYDTGWRFLFSIYVGSTVYQPSTASAVLLEGRKPDGTVFAVPGAFSDGVAVVDCTPSITAAVGKIDCELRVSADGTTVGTANFVMVVEAAPLRGYIASDDDFSAMQQIIDEASESGADAAASASAAAASASAAAVSAATAQVQAGMAYKIAATAAAMTDTSIGYVYTGNETGYVNGGWYYYNGSAWTLGGTAVDPTLSVAGAAADAAACGDLKSALDVTNDRFNVIGTQGKNLFTKTGSESDTTINTTTGETYSYTGYTVSKYIEVTGGSTYVFRAINGVNAVVMPLQYGCFYDGSFNRVSGFSGRPDSLVAPANAKYIRISCVTTDFNNFKCILGLLSDFPSDMSASDYEPFQYNPINVVGTPVKIVAGAVSLLTWNSTDSKYEFTVTQNIRLYCENGSAGVYKDIAANTVIQVPELGSYVYDILHNKMAVRQNGQVLKSDAVLLNCPNYTPDWKVQVSGDLTRIVGGKNYGIGLPMYGNGIAEITPLNAAFSVRMKTNANFYVPVYTGIVASTKAFAISEGTTYSVPEYRYLVADGIDGTISIVSGYGLRPWHGILLATGPYNTDWAKFCSGYLWDRRYNPNEYQLFSRDNVSPVYATNVYDENIAVAKTSCDFSFLINTDVHLYYNIKNVGRPVLNVVSEVFDDVHPDIIVNLGDNIDMGRVDPKPAYYSLMQTVRQTKPLDKSYFIVGNHDYNHISSLPTNRQPKSAILPYHDVYNIIAKHHENDVVWGSKDRVYYYKDFNEQKIRMICLNTLDRPEGWVTVDGVQYDAYTWLSNVIGKDQCDWLIDYALNFMDKGADRSNWHTFILCHSTVAPNVEWNDADVCNGDVFVAISEAFVNGTSVNLSYTDTTFDGYGSISRSADFTSQGAMHLIGWFSGHNHIDTDTEINGIHYITTVCGYPDASIGNSQSMHGLTMTAGTYTEFGADFAVVDKTAKTVTLNRYGIGNTRSFEYL